MIFVHTFGTALIDAGNTRVTPKSALKFAMLLYLWAERGRWVSRAMLRELIYCEQDEKNAGHSLRELVYQLRQRGAVVETNNYGLLLPIDEVGSDYDELLRSDVPDVGCLKTIGAAGFLPGYSPDHSEAYKEWFDGYRARATFELCKSFLNTIDQASIRSDWLMMEHAARACLAVSPVNDVATVALAEVLAVGGARAEALEVLDKYVEEVGPSARGMTLPAAVLRRRIREHLPDGYAVNADFPLVGRQQEMMVLRQRLAMAKTGETQCVVLSGQPGIGKSRLAADCCAWATLAGWRVERVAVQPHDRERPMAAFVEAVPGILKLPGALGAAPESLSALTRLTKHELGDAKVELESAESSDAVSAAIVRAIGDVIDAVTSESPLILLIEDVQWLDVESLRTLAGLVSPRRSRPLLLLLTSRERDSVRYFARHAERLASIEIGELAADVCAMLVRETIGTGWTEADRSFREWLVSASGGNPFFLHSLVRHHQTTGEQFSISPTINALLDQRLAMLTPEAMTVLWTSVALGNHSTLERLVAVLQMQHTELVTTIRELEMARLIGQSGHLVTPAHWLISDAVTRKASAIADKLGHLRIATILEAEAREKNDANKLWDCAQHWLAADELPRAIEMLEQCAQHSIEIGRLREAAELLVKAGSLASQPARHELGCRAIRLAERASELDVVLLASDLIDRTNRVGMHDDIEFAELHARGVLFAECAARKRLNECVVAEHADRAHRINAGRILLVIADLWGGAGLSEEGFEALNRIATPDDGSEDVAGIKFLLLYHATVGDTTECWKLSRRLGGEARRARPEVATELYRYAGAGLWRAGYADEGVAMLTLAFEAAESVGLLRAQFLTANMIASFYRDLGREEEGRNWMEKTERMADDLPTLKAEVPHIAVRFEGALRDNDVAELKRLRDLLPHDSSQGRGAAHRIARALDLAARALSGEHLDLHSAAREVVAEQVVNGETGNVGDLEAGAALALLEKARDLDAARRMLLNYLSVYRRGPTPLGAVLADAIQRLQVSELPSWCQTTKRAK